VNAFLLDTNVVSELIKPRPHPGVAAWVDAATESLLYLSVLTLGEIRKGIASLPQSGKRVALENWLNRDLSLRFSGRILPIDQPVADCWGRLAGEAAARGTPIPVIDGLLAATALCHELTFVTRNIEDISVTRVSSFNPWH
jgi:toxin FitB